MFICVCGGVLLVVAIEEPPEHLSEKEKLVYNQVCDVKCQKCGRVFYSQPYDDGSNINEVKNTKPI
ncbi:hypothetical protein MXM64_12930 [Kurthia gibsonii]|uniref:hypothetical protein n=1 Tax=Kurthia gibsonii TaxID=33946 RepID=UPI002DBA6747|nr:hypothetical protein [Kurthia gibsonii]MEB6113918.1 hypothetical protein [Kurthia gibsonii]